MPEILLGGLMAVFVAMMVALIAVVLVIIPLWMADLL
jgi:hypothetical protein